MGRHITHRTCAFLSADPRNTHFGHVLILNLFGRYFNGCVVGLHRRRFGCVWSDGCGWYLVHDPFAADQTSREKPGPMIAVVAWSHRSAVAVMHARPLTNARDFPVPKRHQGVRIELRNRSFRKGKSHEPSFYAWNRLGKDHLFGSRSLF